MWERALKGHCRSKGPLSLVHASISACPWLPGVCGLNTQWCSLPGNASPSLGSWPADTPGGLASPGPRFPDCPRWLTVTQWEAYGLSVPMCVSSLLSTHSLPAEDPLWSGATHSSSSPSGGLKSHCLHRRGKSRRGEEPPSNILPQSWDVLQSSVSFPLSS